MARKSTAPARLKKYQAKRDFDVSPEPSGDTRRTPRKAKSLFFCVQKHLASHLHYDFRLEHEGVLLSWAVPKGPSLNPADKRLAMRVEDHPYDYGEFEGVIPEGYGAGIVVLWDKGIWKPEVDDVGAALRKGDLKFTLEGVKLKGSWVLVRTRPRGDETESRSWLLIKHRDDWSGAIDITREAPLSVKSSGDFEDVLAADTPAIWESHRPAAGGTAGKLLAQIIQKVAARKAAPEKKPEAKAPVARKRATARSASAGKKPRKRRATRK